MIDSKILIVGLLFHWFGDFVIQTEEEAKNKSSSNRFLFQHVLSYAGVMGIFQMIYGVSGFLGPFTLINAVSHFVIDWVTCRIYKELWTAGETHWFLFL